MAVILIRICCPTFQNPPHSYTWVLKKRTHSYTYHSNLPPIQILVCPERNKHLIYTNSSLKMSKILLLKIILTSYSNFNDTSSTKRGLFIYQILKKKIRRHIRNTPYIGIYPPPTHTHIHTLHSPPPPTRVRKGDGGG